MPSDVIALLRAWAVWSVHDANVGPDVAHRTGSLEGGWASPQVWDADTRRQPRVILIPDDEALTIEHAVVRCGPILAASLRSYFIFQRAPRRRAEVDQLRIAVRRVGELLADALERPAARAAGAGDVRTHPEAP